MTEHNHSQDNVTVPRELLLHAIEFVGQRAKEAHSGSHTHELFTALRAALDQPAVEPVAWRYRITNKALSWAGAWSYSEVDPAHSLESESEVEPLYTAPQAQEKP